MEDRSVSLRSVVAAAFWAVGACLAVVHSIGWLNFGALGIIACMAGATLHVRGFVAGLSSRERNAFHAGRDYEKSRLTLVD